MEKKLSEKKLGGGSSLSTPLIPAQSNWLLPHDLMRCKHIKFVLSLFVMVNHHKAARTKKEDRFCLPLIPAIIT